MRSETCPGCGEPLPERVLCSISHTIVPGKRVCSSCGQKESTDLAWAEGRRTGFVRHQAAVDSIAVVDRVLKAKEK